MPDKTDISAKIGVASIIFQHNKVLLIKRATQPCKGQWTFPGGKLATGETLQQAAERETLEETGISARAHTIAHTFEMIERDKNNVIQFHYIIIDMEADYISGEPRAADDAADARWVSKEELNKLDINKETLQVLNKKYQFN